MRGEEFECPGCEERSTFSENGRFGNLTCDGCGYMPRASVRDEIRSLQTDTERTDTKENSEDD